MNGLHRIKASKETFAKFHGWNTDEITYGRLGSIAFGQITSEILYWCSLHNEIRSYTHIDQQTVRLALWLQRRVLMALH